MKDFLKVFIPQHVPNVVVSGVMGMLGLFKTSKKQVELNRLHNTELLVEKADAPETRQFFTPNTYIENQRQWGKVCFGSKYTMAYGGCEIFAAYNALLSLGREMSGQELVELISAFERKGVVLAGYFGSAPKAAYHYLRKCGYKVRLVSSREESVINALGEESDTVIVTVYNDGRDIFRMIHTVNISKDEEGKYYGHNCYKMQKDASGGTVFVSQGPHESLCEVIREMSGGKAAVLCVIGISKK